MPHNANQLEVRPAIGLAAGLRGILHRPSLQMHPMTMALVPVLGIGFGLALTKRTSD